MKVVSYIPIKLNNQRLPGKNLIPLGGKPLCHYIFTTILGISEIDEKYIYCSDIRIRDYIPEGLIFLQRDEQLDGTEVKCFDIMERFINDVDADIYVQTHVTSPFIKKATLIRALAKVVSGEYDSSFSAQRIQTYAWYNRLPINYDINDIPRTQTLEPVYVETSGFYIFRKEIFTKHRRRIGFNPYICEVDFIESIDIDEKGDYDLAQKLIGK